MDLLKACQENGTALESCSSSASTSNACSSLKNGTVDGSFKTPAVPQKKTNMPLKKRLTTPETEGSESEIAHLNSKIDGLGLVKGVKSEDSQSDSASDSKTDSSNVHPSTKCPNAKKFFVDRYPHLTTKSMSKPAEELLEEMIVDEFSLILFNSVDDYKAFKVVDDEVLKKERAEEEQRRIAATALAAAEESLRLSKLKKKGRKSKAEIERAQRLLRKQERHEKREKIRLRKERHKLRRERGELVPKNETPEQRDQREQRLKERHQQHQIRREQRDKKKQLKAAKKAQQKALNTQAVSTTLHQNPLPPAISVVQRQRLEQLYSMKQTVPSASTMDELVAAAALIFAANPNEAEGMNAVLMAAQNARHQATESAQTPGHSTPLTASSSVNPNENAGQPESSRPGSTVPKRPTSTASAKRPLSVLDQQQQQNGPINKMMKLEEADYKRDLLAMQANQAGSRRNSLQNQQMPPRLYSPFIGMQPMLNGVLPATADPNIRFAIPQIPMGIQRAANPQQQFDAAQLASLQMSGIPISSLLPPGMLPPSLNPIMQQVLNPALSRSQANPAMPTASSVSASGPTSSATQASNPLAANPQLNPFPNNPDFAATLQQALSALNAVDPSLLTLNQLSMGGQNLLGQPMPLTANSLMNQLNEAQKQLEQLGQRQPQRTPLGIQQPNSSPVVHKQSIGGVKPPFMQQQQQIRTAQIPISNIPSKPQMDPKKLPQQQITPRRSQNPSASHSQISTPGESSSSALKNPSINSGTLPIAVVGPTIQGGRPEVTVQATVPLSRPITPTFASSIGIQFPPGTALASQLAGANKLGAKATFGTKSAGDRWNRMHVDVAEILQKMFTESPEMDDGSREVQTCAPFPTEWRVGANSKALHLQSPPKETASTSNDNAGTSKEPAEIEISEVARPEQQGSDALRPRSSADRPKEAPRTSEPNGVNPAFSQAQAAFSQANLQMHQQQAAELARMVAASIPSQVSAVPSAQMRAPTVVSQQQVQEQRAQLLQAQQMGIPTSSVPSVSTEALLRQQLQEVQTLQQQIMASQASQNRVQPQTSAFPFAQKGPTTSRTPVPGSQSSSNAATQLAGAAALHPSLSSVGLGQGGLTAGLPVNSMTSDSVKLMNLFYQQQNAQKQKEAEQLRNMQAVAGREMAKKSNASNLRMKEEEQKQMRQTPRQMQQTPQNQFGQSVGGLQANDLAASYAQNLPPSAQFMLQQLMAGQNNQPLAQMQAALAGGIPANLLEQLALQSRMGQVPQQAMQAAQQRPQNTQPQLLAQQQAAAQANNQLQRQQQLNAQQLAANFPGLQAQIAQSIAAQQPQANITTALSNARPGQLDPNQLLALSLIQQQANMMDNQVARSMAQTSQMSQQHQAQATLDANNADALQQLQQRMMLERSMNPLLQNQSMPQQNQQQSLLQQLQLAQQAQQLQQLQNGLAPINPNQLANLVGGMPNLLEADLLMRQFTGQQPPANLQRNAQDRQQKAEQHRQFREQLLAAANSAPNQIAASSTAGPMAPNLYQLAALQQNGQASAAAQMASLQQQQQALASQLKNPGSLMGTPQKN